MDGYSESAGGWRKYPNNPVLGNSYTGTIFDISVLPETAGFKMYVSWRPKKSIALVKGPDGVRWTEPKIVVDPSIAGDWAADINRPSVIHHDGKYHMWFTGQKDSGSRIGYAVSDDGERWVRVQDHPVLSPDEAWEKVAVMCPHVLWDEQDGLYKMWYSGGEQYEPDAIGYATSRDGRIWKRFARNPIFRENVEHRWEQHKVTACQVVKTETEYLMFYVGFEDIDTARIGIARSKDGVTDWVRNPANPILSPTKGAWDESACYKPFAHYDGSRWVLWYNGRNGAPEYIGYATHDGYDLGFSDEW